MSQTSAVRDERRAAGEQEVPDALEKVTVKYKELRAAASKLIGEFAETYPARLVEQVLVASYERLAAEARIFSFLPVLAERSAREQLRALRPVMAQSDRPRPTTQEVRQ
jgi:hypothetical protein